MTGPIPATSAPVEDAVLDDLRQRLKATRPPTLAGPSGWERGTDAASLHDLLAYWADDDDWRRHEARLRELPGC